MRSSLAIVALAVTGVFTAAADGHAQLAGKWTLEFGEWQTDAGAQVQIRGANRGVLEVTIAGDSVSGMWSGEGTSMPLPVRGKITSGKMVIQGSREGRVNVNGEESTVTIVIEFELSAASNGLTGVMRLKREGADPVWRSATGKKAS